MHPLDAKGVPCDPDGGDPPPSLLLLLLLAVGRLCCSLSWFTLRMTDWCFRSNSTSLVRIFGSFLMSFTSHTESRQKERSREAETRRNKDSGQRARARAIVDDYKVKKRIENICVVCMHAYCSGVVAG